MLLVEESDFIDLHVDTFIPMRLWGYDPSKRHNLGLLRGRFAGHWDLPRMKEAGLSGAMWSVTTNPFRTQSGRYNTCKKNFDAFRRFVSKQDDLAIVNSYRSYQHAKEDGKHAVLLSIQGGNALDGGLLDKGLPDPDLLRVTLLHLTHSKLGLSSSPWNAFWRKQPLTTLGEQTIERLNEKKIFVDLAHIHEKGFWRAMDVHQKDVPLLVTHTGVDGITPHWRNLTDEQIKAVADRGGVVGIMFHKLFLKNKLANQTEWVIQHLEHTLNVAGEDAVGIGTDYDGAVVPPLPFRSGASLPFLVDQMLVRGWSSTRIKKILGLNFLRTLKDLRPDV